MDGPGHPHHQTVASPGQARPGRSQYGQISWAETCTVETEAHPHPSSDWNFSARFPDLPFIYRRSVIKDAIGKVRSYLSLRARWEKSGKKKGKPGLPGNTDHPTLYQGTSSLQLESYEVKQRFVRLKVYDGKAWRWVNYPVVCSRYARAAAPR